MNCPPKIKICDKAREVILTLISCMCDNKAIVSFKENQDGDYKFNTKGRHIDNFQIKYERHELEWAADSQDWEVVINMINTGTSVVEKVISR